MFVLSAGVRLAFTSLRANFFLTRLMLPPKAPLLLVPRIRLSLRLDRSNESLFF
jgi:hypothetical protein